MNPYKLYIKQTLFDGQNYISGIEVDTYAQWGIVCSQSPYKRYGDPKDVVSRNWLDEHGEDVYIPQSIRLKKFDLEISFLCNGTANNVRTNVKDFLAYLMGKPSFVAVTGPRLAIYDTFNDMGWKDVRMKSYSTDALIMDNGDDEVVLEFKVLFEVFDPYTEVKYSASKGIWWQ